LLTFKTHSSARFIIASSDGFTFLTSHSLDIERSRNANTSNATPKTPITKTLLSISTHLIEFICTNFLFLFTEFECAEVFPDEMKFFAAKRAIENMR